MPEVINDRELATTPYAPPSVTHERRITISAKYTQAQVAAILRSEVLKSPKIPGSFDLALSSSQVAFNIDGSVVVTIEQVDEVSGIGVQAS